MANWLEPHDKGYEAQKDGRLHNAHMPVHRLSYLMIGGREGLQQMGRERSFPKQPAAAQRRNISIRQCCGVVFVGSCE